MATLLRFNTVSSKIQSKCSLSPSKFVPASDVYLMHLTPDGSRAVSLVHSGLDCGGVTETARSTSDCERVGARGCSCGGHGDGSSFG